MAQSQKQANVANGNTKELGLNRPTSFTGDRQKVNTFLQECNLYLLMNRDIYTTDEAKIVFILSYMTDKEALQWKEQYLTSITDNNGNMMLPRYGAFITLLKKAFKPADKTGEAMNKLCMIKQGNQLAEELVTEFRLLAEQANLEQTSSSDHLHLIGLFCDTLNPPLAKRIMNADKVPTTITKQKSYPVQLKLPNGSGHNEPRKGQDTQQMDPSWSNSESGSTRPKCDGHWGFNPRRMIQVDEIQILL